jgi:hypothetical protein
LIWGEISFLSSLYILVINPHKPFLHWLCFQMESRFVPGLARTAIFLFMLMSIAGLTDAYHCAQSLVEMGPHEFFA